LIKVYTQFFSQIETEKRELIGSLKLRARRKARPQNTNITAGSQPILPPWPLTPNNSTLLVLKMRLTKVCLCCTLKGSNLSNTFLDDFNIPNISGFAQTVKIP
jgi:hypothetical protein